jgi:hypothetical protein
MIEVHFILTILACSLAVVAVLLFVLHRVVPQGGWKLRQLLSVVLFSLLLIIPILNIDWIGGGVSETENRVLAGLPFSIDQTTRTISTSRKSIESYINDNIGFRSFFVKLYTNLKFKGLGIVTSDRVQKGRDGWYFYTLDSNIELASGDYPDFDEKALAAICEQQIRIQEKLREQGIEYVLILPPSKVSIYPEMLTSGDYTVGETPVDRLADYLEEHSDLNVVRVKDALLKEKQESGEQLFFKTDTHWNEYGANIAYREVIASLNRWGLMQSSPVDIQFVTSTFSGEFSKMLGDPSLLSPEQVLESEILHPNAVLVQDGERFQKFHEELAKENNWGDNRLYQNTSSNGPDLLLFGDSMFHHWNMPELFAEHCSYFTFVRSYDIEQGIIDAVKPKIVAYEIAERFLNRLAEHSEIFVRKALDNPQAEIVSLNLPPCLVAGQKHSFSVAVKNTGEETWMELDLVRLGIFQNGVDCGYGGRAYLPAGVSVAPGETYTFTFQDFVPSIPGAKLEFTMLQEGITYFGERREADTEIVSK